MGFGNEETGTYDKNKCHRSHGDSSWRSKMRRRVRIRRRSRKEEGGRGKEEGRKEGRRTEDGGRRREA